MKRKICLSLIVSIFLLSNISICFGQAVENRDVSPKYIGTVMHTELFKMDSNGEFRTETSLYPKYDTSYDKVVISIKITRNATDTVVYNKTFTTVYNEIRDWFSVSTTYNTAIKGLYSMDATYKCYKDGKLIETIKGVTKTAIY